MSRTLPLICASLVLALAAAPAFAQDRRVATRVYVGDLDPYSVKDADELLDRVDRAAYDICADREHPVPPTERRSTVECEVASVDETVRNLDHPVITARHQGLDPRVIIEEEGSADPYYDPYYTPKG
jgi:UrcA family protein